MLFIPAGTVTEAGIMTDVRLLASFTTKPPLVAKPLSKMVPVDEFPPTRVDGLKLKEASPTGSIVSVAVFETPDSVAVIVAAVCVLTAVVVIVNVVLA
jgi:hypothetical protein